MAAYSIDKCIRVLLIDDDEDESLIFETALEELDYNIDFSFYPDSTVAVSKLKNTCQTPDFVFLDWNMPKMSGKDCLTAIRELPGYNSVRVIMYTTSNAAVDKSEARRMGASYFLNKPITVSELARELNIIFSSDWQVNQKLY
jgi:DNA-binding response OmpR family regulator